MQQTGIEKAGGLPGTQKDDKKVVAGSAAIGIVVVLLIAWGYFFIHKIQMGSQEINLSAGTQDQFNFTNVKDAQKQFQSSRNNLYEELQDLRTQNDSSAVGTQQQTLMQVGESDANQFSNPTQ